MSSAIAVCETDPDRLLYLALIKTKKSSHLSVIMRSCLPLEPLVLGLPQKKLQQNIFNWIYQRNTICSASNFPALVPSTTLLSSCPFQSPSSGQYLLPSSLWATAPSSESRRNQSGRYIDSPTSDPTAPKDRKSVV